MNALTKSDRAKLLADAHAKQLEPDDDESLDDWMDRCGDEIDDEDVCQMIWDESKAAKDVLRKTHAETVNGMEFVLSDETPDRMDDIIMSDGWDLTHFKKNPIALFNHNPNFVIGKWANINVDPKNKQLRGHLELAPAGTSPRIDEIRKLIEAGILKAVSVGFRPIERKSRNEKDQFGFSGSIFHKSELVETSLVAVPANPNALAGRQVTEDFPRNNRSGLRRERRQRPDRATRVHRRACRKQQKENRRRSGYVARSTRYRTRRRALWHCATNSLNTSKTSMTAMSATISLR